MFVLCVVLYLFVLFVFFFKQKTAYEMRISDWSSDVCSSDLVTAERRSTADNLTGERVGAGAPPRPPRAGPMACCPIRAGGGATEIGRASCRERVCQYV